MEGLWRINMQNLSKQEMRQLFEEGMSFALRKTQADLIEETIDALSNVVPEKSLSVKDAIEFLSAQIELLLLELSSLKSDYTEFSKKYTGAKEMEVIHYNILEYAKHLGANKKQLMEDEQAFARWFDFDAVSERCFKKVSLLEKKLNFFLQKLGILSAFLLKTANTEEEYFMIWRELNLEKIIQPVLTYERVPRICTTAFRALVVSLKTMPSSMRQVFLEETTLHYIHQSALDNTAPLWIQCEALSFLASFSTEKFYTVLFKRLQYPASGDDFFLRSRAVMLLGEGKTWQSNFEDLLKIICKDPSPFVRQRLPEALKKAPYSVIIFWIRHLTLNDSAKEVKAKALLEIPFHLKNVELLEQWKLLLEEILLVEKNVFVIRVALEVVVQCLSCFIDKADEKNVQSWWEFFMPKIQTIHLNASALSLRRYAAATLERLWCICFEKPRTLKVQLEKLFSENLLENKIKILAEQFQAYSENIVARVLSVIAQDDFGYEIEYDGQLRWVRRGYQMGFRLWRFLFEMRHPHSEKRQGFSHTVGRIFSGNIHVPSIILSEVSETRVPGEPYLIATESGWRPYLPLVDELYSCLTLFDSKPFIIYTSEGVTFVTPPLSYQDRLNAKWALIWRFQYFAELRNWHEKSQFNPNIYVQALRKLGIEVRFEPHEYSEQKQNAVDSTVMRFFL